MLGATAWRRPKAIAVIDERGSIEYGALWAQIQSVAGALAARGIGRGARIGILCRNHRQFIVVSAASQLLRARLLFLNTAFAAPQLADVGSREGMDLLIYDPELRDAVSAVPADLPRLLAWSDGTGEESVEDLAHGGTRFDRAEGAPSEVVILTSGTTGTPRGAIRPTGSALPRPMALLAVLRRLPVGLDETMLIAAPLFHTWGNGALGLAAVTSSTIVLQSRFDPRELLAAVARHRPRVLIIIPTMMQRIMELGPDVHRQFDLSSLRIVAASGSALPGELAHRWMNAFGDHVYNVYGSTELGLIAFATPAELRVAAQTIGQVTPGVRVSIVDEANREVQPGVSGRILVGTEAAYAGYTDGSRRPVHEGMIVTGDMGHFDARGWFYIDGREDDMIISGGENVFPAEIENLLADHPAVLEVAVIGVPDREFGQRLKAFVVPRAGHKISEDDVKTYVRDHLARFKVPRDVLLVEALPRNATGKIVRRQLS
jgi:acyl-CoA synthetase (AMP-forming)/AMP-acid ligase II